MKDRFNQEAVTKLERIIAVSSHSKENIREQIYSPILIGLCDVFNKITPDDTPYCITMIKKSLIESLFALRKGKNKEKAQCIRALLLFFDDLSQNKTVSNFFQDYSLLDLGIADIKEVEIIKDTYGI